MTRYRDDFDCPVAFAEQTVPGTLAEVLERRRPAAAPRRRDGEVRTRDLLLQRRRRGAVGRRGPHPRPVAARCRELRPEARDVRAPRSRRASRRRSATAYSFCVVNFANPDMVGHTGVIPAVVTRGRDGRRVPGRGRRGDAPRGRRLPRHRRPRKRREAPRGRRRQPAHGAHDEPGAARPDPRGRALRDGGELSDSPRPSSICSGSRSPTR